MTISNTIFQFDFKKLNSKNQVTDLSGNNVFTNQGT